MLDSLEDKSSSADVIARRCKSGDFDKDGIRIKFEFFYDT